MKKTPVELLLASWLLVTSEAHAVVDIFMEPNADGDGTASDPVGSLDQVKAIAATITNDDIAVQILPGEYFNQHLSWDNPIIDGQVITFRPWEGASGWPKFVGPGIGSKTKFFKLAAGTGDQGKATNLRFWHLKIEEYWGGIFLTGGKDQCEFDPADSSGEMDENDICREAWNSNNEVMDVRFRFIGTRYAGDGSHNGYGLAALHLVNSRDNKVRFNWFYRIENIAEGDVPDPNQDPDPAEPYVRAIHGMYIAHYSSGNDIRFNFFGYNSGDSIKTRDFSNDNYIWGNAFWRSGYNASVARDIYENANSSTHRTSENWSMLGSRWECPSYANNVRYNDFSKGYDGMSVLPGVLATGDLDPSYETSIFNNYPDWYFHDCPEDFPLDPGETLKRFSTASNDYTSSWSTISGIFSSWEGPGGVLEAWRLENNIN